MLTAADIPGKNDIAPVFADEPLFADKEILFHGQALFAVVARERDAARRAARLARIDIAEGPPAVTIEDALATGARVLPDYEFRRGDVERAVADAPHRLEGVFRIGGQEHFYLEGQASLAIPGEAGEMTVHCSTQDPTEVQHIVARVLGLPDAFVTVETRRMGGGFGGKESQACAWAAIAALGARVTGAPCKVRLDRDDDFQLTGKRHDFRADWRVGYDDAGRVGAYDVMLNARCGCSADLSLGVVDRAMFHASNSYWLPDVRDRLEAPEDQHGLQHRVSRLRRPAGHDRDRARDGRDRARARARSARRAQGQFLSRRAAIARPTASRSRMARRCRRSSRSWRPRATIARAGARYRAFNAKSPILKRGLALTPVMFGISFTLIHLNQAGALVHVYSDGSVHLNHGGTEMGQGLFTKVAQVVAEEFGIPLEWVRITATNTAKVPNASPTAASSGTDINGMAAQAGARQIKRRMVEFAAAQWGVAPEAVAFRDGRVFGGNASMTFGELAKACRLNRVQLSAAGYYKTPEIHWDRANASGKPFFYFAYGAACSEVVDRYADRRNEGAARRHPARRRRLAQSRARSRSGRGRLHPGDGLADDRGAGVRRQGPADDPCAGDLQDSRRLRHAAGIPHAPAHAAEPDRQHLSLEGGRRAAVDAGDLGLFGDPRRGARGQAGRAGSARGALHAGGDLECDPFARRVRARKSADTLMMRDGPRRPGQSRHAAVSPPR